MTGEEQMAGPLEAVRVLDLTTMVAGPVATRMLADQGADVIKIESPNGDLMRRFNPIRNGMSASFLSCNRNKRSLAVDLKAAEGLAIVHKLIATADVLVHNFRPGAAELEKWPANEILPRLLAHDVPAAPVLSRLELLTDGQVQANHILAEYQSPTFGRVRQPRPAAQFDRTPAGVRELAPLLGADNAAILNELGYSGDDMAHLERGGVLHSEPAKAQSE
jgi:crotonobetainyl-CoA:carnitine CoA-transferase CaiB-like acyl-CoA transferase